MDKGIRVDRDGRVWRGDLRVGSVDHYNPSRPAKRSHLWRAVREGGRFRFGFTTRAEAVEWLTA